MSDITALMPRAFGQRYLRRAATSHHLLQNAQPHLCARYRRFSRRTSTSHFYCAIILFGAAGVTRSLTAGFIVHFHGDVKELQLRCQFIWLKTMLAVRKYDGRAPAGPAYFACWLSYYHYYGTYISTCRYAGGAAAAGMHFIL